MKNTATPPAAPTPRDIVKRALKDVPDTSKPAVNAAGMIFLPGNAQQVGSPLDIPQLERLSHADLARACKARGLRVTREKDKMVVSLWLHLTANKAPILLTVA